MAELHITGVSTDVVKGTCIRMRALKDNCLHLFSYIETSVSKTIPCNICFHSQPITRRYKRSVETGNKARHWVELYLHPRIPPDKPPLLCTYRLCSWSPWLNADK
ncbi:uncharacterized protein CIMG_13622 [Coccidioides immitis RS]|uniref:Uncharacterized protein n=1 Tax=Coccidioides immitis (strain RS) TaxID=246410 RepID=A0A0D8JVR1_COCIM|nr:uncharacterized protein CIMG_13622 [Coccidioides immitis RS]KJF61397.1 hypothetical protein CIMG_13622 [Coccidioides immitis RS]